MKRIIRDTAATLIAIVAGTFTAFGQAPANDNFAVAEQLSGIRASVVRNNINATKEGGEPNHAFNTGGKSVWFKWTAPMDRAMSISTGRSATNIDTLLAVYVGTSVNSLGNWASSDDIVTGLDRRSHVVIDAQAGTTYYIAVDGASVEGAPAASGSFKLDIRPFFGLQGADQNGDGITDPAVFRPSTGDWYLNGLFEGQLGMPTDVAFRHWGTSGDIPVVAAKGYYIDTTVFRPSTGTWYNSSGCCTGSTVQFGMTGDIPAPSEFGGGSESTFTVFRPSNGTWYMYYPDDDLNAQMGSEMGVIQFGQAGDIPVPGNYSPDMIADVAVFRPTNGVWYILERRPNGVPTQIRVVQFGLPGDKPAPGDYDGDGILDPAIYRPSTGTWWVLRSTDNQQHAYKWGIAEDIPVTGDYDGDGIFDFAVFRPSTGDWYIRNSENGSYRILHWGATGDIPVTSNLR